MPPLAKAAQIEELIAAIEDLTVVTADLVAKLQQIRDRLPSQLESGRLKVKDTGLL